MITLNTFVRIRFLFGQYSDLISSSKKLSLFLKLFCVFYSFILIFILVFFFPSAWEPSPFLVITVLEFTYYVLTSLCTKDKTMLQFNSTLVIIDKIMRFDGNINCKCNTISLYLFIIFIKCVSEISCFNNKFLVPRLVFAIMIISNYLRFTVVTYKLENLWKRLKFLRLFLSKGCDKTTNYDKLRTLKQFLYYYKHLLNVMDNTNSELKHTVS